MDEKEDYLELNTRRKIFNLILKNPGLHERELSRQLDTPLSTLDYHLNYLKKRGLIEFKSDGHYAQYFVTGNISVKDKEILVVLRQKILRKILIFLMLNNSSYHKDISSYLGLALSTTSFHLNKLVKCGIVSRTSVGRETLYSVKEPDYISDLLVIYQKTFWDAAVDRFVDTWLDLHTNDLRKVKKY